MGGWEKYLKFRCTGCGNCCKGTYLMVTDADVRRITKGSKRPLDYFLHFRPVETINMSQSTPWGVKMNARRMLMTVKWRGGHCKFLDDDNRCTIYTHRPAVCRSHPFTVTMSETGGVEKMEMSRVVPCPCEWDGQTSRRDLGALERWSGRESDAYLERVTAWNRKRSLTNRSPREFLRFIGLTD